MRMSIRTTSGRSRSTSRTASWPSAASPTTSMSGAVSSNTRTPARTTPWSSATNARITTAGRSGSPALPAEPGAPATWARSPSPTSRARAWARRRSLHPTGPPGPASRPARGPRPAAPSRPGAVRPEVIHAQPQQVGRADGGCRPASRCRAGMLEHIGERLLHKPRDRGPGHQRHFAYPPVEAQRALARRPGAHGRRHRRWPPLARSLAVAVDRVRIAQQRQQPGAVRRAPADRRWSRRRGGAATSVSPDVTNASQRGTCPQRHRADVVRDNVMQIAGQPGALHPAEPRGSRPRAKTSASATRSRGDPRQRGAHRAGTDRTRPAPTSQPGHSPTSRSYSAAGQSHRPPRGAEELR